MSTQGFYLSNQSKFESNARTYPRKLPIAIQSASGLFVKNTDGRVFMDCLCGAGTLALGHNHPVQIAAIRQHLDSGRPLHTLDLTTPLKDEFVAAVFSTLPPELRSNARIHFCSPSGSDAVEAAIKLAKTATGRRGVIAFSGGYHGHTQGALSLMGNRGPKKRVPGLSSDVHFLPFPYVYRCPIGAPNCPDRPSERRGCGCASYSNNLLSDPESGLPPIAGLIVESIQGEGGVIPAEVEWFRAISQIARAQEKLLILDEVQTGWGRTGKLYGFDHAGVVPDILILSKAIGGGLPLAVIIYRGELDVWEPGAHTGTFRGNQLAMAAGLATLRFLLDNDIPGHVANVGDRLMERLCVLKERHAFVGDVRGRGLMIGIEIVDPEQLDHAGRPRADGPYARQLQKACFRNNLIVELGGRDSSVLRLLPPLNVTEGEADMILTAIETAFEEVADGPLEENLDA